MNTLKENLIKELLQNNLNEINTIYDLIQLYNLQNEQYVLDWLDSLNEISIRN